VGRAARAHERHEGRHEQHEREDQARTPPDEAAGIRAIAATTTSATPHSTHTGHADIGVETATTVTPSRPSSLARGSSRWMALAGSPARLIGRGRRPLIAGLSAAGGSRARSP
jgi:hypothetical protein